MEELIKKAYRIALVSYYGVFIGAILIALLGFKVSQHSFVFPEETVTVISTLSYLFLIISIPLILWLYNKKISNMTTNATERVSFYGKWIKVRVFTIGAGLFLNIFLFYLFHSYSFLYAAGISAIALLFCKPNKNTIENELIIPEEED
jgi:hypothetical protein